MSNYLSAAKGKHSMFGPKFSSFKFDVLGGIPAVFGSSEAMLKKFAPLVVSFQDCFTKYKIEVSSKNVNPETINSLKTSYIALDTWLSNQKRMVTVDGTFYHLYFASLMDSLGLPDDTSATN